MTRLVLGPASTGRRKVLRQAGVEPLIVVSGIDEERLIAGLPSHAGSGEVVCALAQAKAEQVAGELDRDIAADCVVIGCDSMLYLDGELCSKLKSAAARQLWQSMAGRSGQLYTGHCVIRLQDNVIINTEAQTAITTVHFVTPSPEDLEAYLADDDSLRVAGGFTLDGLGGWFVDGDPAGVIGIGLPVTRELLHRVACRSRRYGRTTVRTIRAGPDGRLWAVPLIPDPSPTLTQYAHPERLVTADWLSGHMGSPGLAIVESDEDVLLYDVGHIPGAVKIDWHTDLNDPRVRDYITGEQFAELMDRKGISRDDTVVIYGDKSNWWAAYALWVFKLFDHPDVRLLNGGRDLWLSERRDTSLEVPTKTSTGYPVVVRNDAPIRAFKEDVLGILGHEPLIDVRSPDEYAGKRTHMPDYPEEGALRAGHIPTAQSIPWGKAVDDSGRFRSREELEELYGFLVPDDNPVVYCRIGERSSHTWFVLTYLLGKPGVRNYDGSWSEWGNTVRVPIVAGESPGAVPV